MSAGNDQSAVGASHTSCEDIGRRSGCAISSPRGTHPIGGQADLAKEPDANVRRNVERAPKGAPLGGMVSMRVDSVRTVEACNPFHLGHLWSMAS